ncbi:MAG: HEAT repeat domain-containing protein [Candidatus Firestonebacteria bacterium]
MNIGDKIQLDVKSVIKILVILILIANLPLNVLSEENRENKRLKIFITLNKSEFKIGDELILDLNFKNISDSIFHFYFCPANIPGLQFINKKEEICDKFSTVRYYLASPEYYIYKLSPGEKKTFNFKSLIRLSFSDLGGKLRIGKPVIAFDDINHIILEPGRFKVVFNYKKNEYVFGLYNKDTNIRDLWKDVWIGELFSNTLVFDVRLPAPNEIKEQIEFLRTGNIERKIEAIRFVQANLEKKGVPYLLEILEKGDGKLKGLSGDAIWIIGDINAMPKLLEIYKKKSLKYDNYQDIGEQRLLLDTIFRLEKDNQKKRDFLIKVINLNPSEEIRCLAVNKFGSSFKDEEAINFLINLLENSEPIIRREVVNSFYYTYYPSNESKEKMHQVLLNLLENENDTSIRYDVIRTLGKIGRNTDIIILEKLLENNSSKDDIQNIKHAIEEIKLREKL